MKHAKRRRRSRRKSQKFTLPTIHLVIICVLVIAVFSAYLYFSHFQFSYTLNNGAISLKHFTVKQEYLTPNPYSRSQKALKKVNAIVVHYTANANTSAESNRSYFNGLATSHTTRASAHFIIDPDGTILQIIPLNEVAYANYPRNYDTISIECCYKDTNGKFTNATYQSLIALVKALMSAYHLDSGDVIRHYDVTGKLCPLYYVRNPKEWTLFKQRLDGWNIFGVIYL